LGNKNVRSNLVHFAGDHLSIPCAKRAKSESRMSALKSWHRAILIALLGGLAVALLAWIARTDPAISFLPRHRGADWIVFPTAADSRAHWSASLDTTFRREFILPTRPVSARISLRAMRRAEVKVNGVSIPLPQNDNWKNVSDVEITEQLREGANIVEVRVFNQNGPPALWLLLNSDQVTVRTDQSWETSFAGSSWRNAALACSAKIPGRGNLVASDKSTFDAATKIWPLWILLLGIASAGIILWRAAAGRLRSETWERIVLLLFAGLWLLLFWNNSRLLPFHAGFDYGEHLKYIEYIQKNWSLPLPTEGLEMYQPPLYYLIGAAALSACKLSINDPQSVVALRLLGGFFGIAQFVLVFLSLRLLLPVRAACIGLLVAAFVPMHLYLAHYVTNEMLAATLATVVLYLCLRLLTSEVPRASQIAWLGVALGTTMLTKVTGILLLPIVIAALAGRLRGARVPITIAVRNIGLLVAICFAVCGWQYARIWVKFGTPLVGNWDVISGFSWWQDPGYHTAVDYLRFGRSLVYPFFSGFAGFADGIYSTLWGDALCGGASSLTFAWNHQALVGGYLWALIPTALIVIGAVIAIIQFVRKPTSELFLLLGFSAVLVLGLIFMTLKIPSYAQAKAFYALSAITPFCFFGALGWETLTHGSERMRFVLGTLILVWALNSFATYWITPSVGQHLYAARALATYDKIDQANAEAAKAVQIDPSNAAARGLHALSLSELGDDAGAVKEAERAVQLAPTDSEAHVNLAITAARTDVERAISESRRAIELGPENFSAYQMLMKCLVDSKRNNEAATFGPEWLAVSPFDVAAHSSLAAAMAQTGDLVTAARQFGYVMMIRPNAEDALAQVHQILVSLAKTPDGLQRLRDIAGNAPDSPRMLDELAWLLATYPDSDVRDGAEAVRLAERACKLTDRRDPALLATLAAAYAETGDFSRGVAAGEEALRRAQAIGDTESVKLSENVLSAVRADLPYRHKPEQ
jgi:tetratricopeptide (TPR) repeat protein